MATGDLTISWTRRARGLNDWIDGIDVPLLEASESYLVSILGDDQASVVRTIEASGESAVYAAADQAADFPGAYVPAIDGLGEAIYFDGSGWYETDDATLYADAAGLLTRDINLIGLTRLDQIDGGAGTVTIAAQAKNASGSRQISLGFQFLAINGQSLGIDDATPAAPGTSYTEITHTAAVPAWSRLMRLRVLASGSGLELQGPWSLTMASALRPVFATVQQRGFGDLLGFAGRAVL